MPLKSKKTNLPKEEKKKTLDDFYNQQNELIRINTEMKDSFNNLKTTLENHFTNELKDFKDVVQKLTRTPSHTSQKSPLPKFLTLVKACLTSSTSSTSLFINGFKIIKTIELDKDFLANALNKKEENLSNKLNKIFGIEFKLSPPKTNSTFIDIINSLATASKEAIVQKDLNDYFKNPPSNLLTMLDTHATSSNLPLPSTCSSAEGVYTSFQLSGKPNYLSFFAPITLELKCGGSEESDILTNADLKVITEILEQVYCLIKINHLFNYYVSFATSGHKAWLVVGSLKPKLYHDDPLQGILSVAYHIIPIEIKDILSIWITLSQNSSIFFSKYFASVKNALQDLSVPLAYCAIRYVSFSGSPVFGISIARSKVQPFPIFDVLHPDFTIKICNPKKKSYQGHTEIYFLKKIQQFSASRYVIKTIETNKGQENITTFFGIQDMPAVLKALNITIPDNIDLHENIKNVCLDTNILNATDISIEKSWLFGPSLNENNLNIFSSILMYNGIGFNRKFKCFSDFFACDDEAFNNRLCQGDPRTSNLMYFDIPNEAFGNLKQRKGFIIDYDNGFEFDANTNSYFIPNKDFPEGAIKDNLNKHVEIILNDNNELGWQFQHYHQINILNNSITSGPQFSTEDEKKKSFFQRKQIEPKEKEEELEEEESSNSDDDDKEITGKKRKLSASINLNPEYLEQEESPSTLYDSINNINFSVEDCMGDGNCLLHAVKDQLINRLKRSNNIDYFDPTTFEIRSKLFLNDKLRNQIEKVYVDIQLLQVLLSANNCKNIYEYCYSKLKPGAYLDEPEIHILADYFNIRIRIYCYTKRGPDKMNEIGYTEYGSESHNLIYLFLVNMNHYQSLYPL